MQTHDGMIATDVPFSAYIPHYHVLYVDDDAVDVVAAVGRTIRS